jgi:colanic acid/amylovoran biosynthesis protein
MTTKILLINVHSFHNAGDHALTQVAIQQLKSRFPDCQLTLIMDDPESFAGDEKVIGSFFTWLKTARKGQEPRWVLRNLLLLIPVSLVPILTFWLTGKPLLLLSPSKVRNLLTAYLSSDLIISAPGGFLYHSGKGITLLISAYTIALGWLAGKPIYVLPQSIGPFIHKWECQIIRWVLSPVRKIMVREEISLRELMNCQIPLECCHLLPDLAFAFRGATEASAVEWLENQGIDLDADRPILGVTVINWGAQNSSFNLQSQYETALADASCYFLNNYGGRIVFIPQVWGPSPSNDDRIPTRRIIEMLPITFTNILYIDQPPAPNLLKAIYGQLDFFIGTRMHSNIFALSQYVPTIAIGYQHKTLGITKMLGIDQWTIEIQQISGQILKEKIDDLFDSQETVRRHLIDTIPILVQQSERAGEIIESDYSNLIKVPIA